MAPEGPCVTIGRGAQHLGVPVAFAGCLSGDAVGDRLRGELAESDVDLSFVAKTTKPTTLALASVDANGAASYSFYFDQTSAGHWALTICRPGSRPMSTRSTSAPSACSSSRSGPV